MKQLCDDLRHFAIEVRQLGFSLNGGWGSGNAWISVNTCLPRLNRLRPERPLNARRFLRLSVNLMPPSAAPLAATAGGTRTSRVVNYSSLAAAKHAADELDQLT